MDLLFQQTKGKRKETRRRMWECCGLCSSLAASFRLLFVLLDINPAFSTKSVVSPAVWPAGSTTLSPTHGEGQWNIDYCWELHAETWLLWLHGQAGRETMAVIWNEAAQCSAKTQSNNSEKWAQTLTDKWQGLGTDNEHYVPGCQRSERHFHTSLPWTRKQFCFVFRTSSLTCLTQWKSVATKMRLKLLNQAEIILSIYAYDEIRINHKNRALLPNVSESLTTRSGA